MTTHTAPLWWDEFIEKVRETGKVRDSLASMEKKLSPRAHEHHINNSKELEAELDDAISEGTERSKRARVLKVLEHLKSGATMQESLVAAGEHKNSIYILLEQTGLEPEYAAIRDYWNLRRNGHSQAIGYTDGKIAAEMQYYKEVDAPASELREVLLEYGHTLRLVLAELDCSVKEMEGNRGVPMRNAAIRAVGRGLDLDQTEEGFPPFLEEGE